ncbi:MAG: ABC transporter substrate-binding protein [Anaerolineae bacterium]|nr:ABC transporter substrate-binding protein [Anaerolineae bacterium]
MRKILVLLMVCALMLGTTSFALAQSDTIIRVGSKDFAEQFVLGQMIVLVLENAGLKVEDRVNLGGSKVNRDALVNGEIDVYPEYTGTAISNYFRDVTYANIPEGASQNGYMSFATVSSLDAAVNDLIWLNPSPASNTYALAIKRSFSEENKMTSLEDFAKYINDGGKVVVAVDDEFAQRPDGLASFEKTYDFTFKEGQVLIIAGATPAQTQQMLNEDTNGVNVAMAFSTDGALLAYNFVVLSDDKGAQPVFQPAPVFRGSVLRANPQIPGLLNPVFASLDVVTLQGLNAQVEVDGENPKEVARKYLTDKGFIK